MIEVRNLSKSFDVKKIFSSINLTVKFSSIVLIHGISGSGKTTLLNIIAGLEQASSGEVLIDDRNVSFQDEVLLKDYVYYSSIENDLIVNSKVIDNLFLINSNKEFINKLLNEFHLEKYKNTKVKKLSKGERERISLLKALLSKQRIILFDEPTANLDKENSVLFIKALNKYLNQRTVIICSHDYQLLKDYVDELYKLENSSLTKEYTANKYNGERSIIKYNDPQKLRILSKIALTKIFRRKVFLGFNIFFLFLFLSCLYLTLAYATVDVDSYLIDYISDNVEDDGFVSVGLFLDYYDGPIAKYLAEERSAFFVYVDGTSTIDPNIPDLEKVSSYKGISLSVFDFNEEISFSEDFDYQYSEYFIPIIINSFQKDFIESYFNMFVDVNTIIPYETDDLGKGMVVADIVEVNINKVNLRDAFNYFPVLTKLEYIEEVIRYRMSFTFDEYEELRTLYINKYQDDQLSLPTIFYGIFPFSYLEDNNVDYTLFNENEFGDNDFLITAKDYDQLSLYIDKYPEAQEILDFLSECDLFEDTKQPGLSGIYSLKGTYDGNTSSIIVSDTVFDKIIQNMYDGYLYSGYSYNHAFLTKDFTLDNIYLLSNTDLTLVGSNTYNLSSLRNQINAFDAKRNMFSIFSYIILGLFIVLFSTHYLLVFIDIRRDCSILLLNGYNKKDIHKLISIFFSIIFAFGFAFWVCFLPLFDFIVQIFDNLWVYYYIPTNITLSAFVPLFVIIGLILIYSTSSLLIKKDKMFDIIKNT